MVILKVYEKRHGSTVIPIEMTVGLIINSGSNNTCTGTNTGFFERYSKTMNMYTIAVCNIMLIINILIHYWRIF